MRFPNQQISIPQFMISYFVYFISILLLHDVLIHRIRFLFTLKAIVTPIIGLLLAGEGDNVGAGSVS
ncbi:hypothetical protein V1520DRAFT_337124 [Lipomyces starkeyi]